MAQKPSIPKGTRDFGPQETAERNYIFDTIRSVFRTYGYAQIETPAIRTIQNIPERSLISTQSRKTVQRQALQKKVTR